MRLLFFRPGPAIHCPEPAVPFQSGVPTSAGSTIAAHAKAFDIVGNAGNMIHRMAMVQMLDFDPLRSSHVNLFKLIKKMGGVKSAARLIEENFDGVVLTMSNIIRAGASEGEIGALVEELKCDVYCVGAGLQDDIPADLSLLEPDLQHLLRVLNDKARLLGVRGHQTERWLRAAGISRAQAIGCPSMFVYPRNISTLRPPKKIDRIISAGHMTPSDMASKTSSRARDLLKAFDGVKASYVFQGEIRNFKAIAGKLFVYDEATSRLNATVVSNAIRKASGLESPFSTYYSFNEVGAWRQACLRYNAYVGDRIHGGVAAMQAGVPALVLYQDARVAELVDYHGIPSCHLSDFARLGCRAAVEQHLQQDAFEKFRNKYLAALRVFSDAISASGLRLATQPEIDFVLSPPVEAAPAIQRAG